MPGLQYGATNFSGSAGELATATHATHGAHAGTHAGTAHRGVHLSGPVRHGVYVRRSSRRNPVEERTIPVGHLIRRCGSGVIGAGQVRLRCGVALNERGAKKWLEETQRLVAFEPFTHIRDSEINLPVARLSNDASFNQTGSVGAHVVAVFA